MDIVALGSRLDIGYVAENNAREIGIDIAQLLSKWPTAVPHLMVVRPGEDLAYTAETRVDGTVLVWTIKNIDTALPGRGEAQVFMIEDDTELLGKSEVMSTLVRKCITCTEVGEAPEPVRPWMEQIKDDASAAEAARVAAGKSATAAANSAKSASDSLTNVQSAERTALQNIGAFSESVLNLAPMIKGSARGDGVVAVNDSAVRPLVGLTLYGKTTQDGVHAGAGGSIGVTLAGKNLFQDRRNSKADYTSNGITFVTNADGTFTANGTNDTTSRSSMTITTGSRWLYLPAGTYTVSSGLPNGDGYFQVSYNDEMESAGSTAVYAYATPKTFTIDKPKYAWMAINVLSGKTVENLVFKPQIEVGAVATEYEPYQAYQAIAVTTPDGLRGVQVPSGGNYTDTNGQKWISDEVDLGRGVHVQRCEEADGVVSAIETPVETELSAEELSAYAALLTQYPNSTLFCDADCGVTVSYAVDTKQYIDNKFAELAAASLNA